MDWLIPFLGALFVALAITGLLGAEYIERAVEELSSYNVQIAAITAASAINLFRYGGYVSLILACLVLITGYWPNE